MQSVTLRQWRNGDLDPYAAMNRDPRVMRYFPSLLDREQSAASLRRQRDLIEQRGWGLWVVDVDGEFAGFTGLAVPSFDAPFLPCVEIGWRLRPEYWGRGIAVRAAGQAVHHAFTVLRLPELVSFTAAINLPSRRLMERLQFSRDHAGDFPHPAIPAGHELCPHVLYRLPATLRPESNPGAVLSI
jgi:RimJ/RimL family protein N-acetyltransferase